MEYLKHKPSILKYLIYFVLDIELQRRTFGIIQSALFLMILWRQAKERCWNVRAENRGTEYLRELTTRTSLYKHFLSPPQCIFCSSYCIRSINKFRYAINQPQIKSFCLMLFFICSIYYLTICYFELHFNEIFSRIILISQFIKVIQNFSFI